MYLFVLQVSEICALLGLMFKYSCEDCQLVAYGNKTFELVETEPGTILDNMRRVLELRLVRRSFSIRSIGNQP